MKEKIDKYRQRHRRCRTCIYSEYDDDKAGNVPFVLCAAKIKFLHKGYICELKGGRFCRLYKAYEWSEE